MVRTCITKYEMKHHFADFTPLSEQNGAVNCDPSSGYAQDSQVPKGGTQNIVLKIFVDFSPEKNELIAHVEDKLLLPPHHDPIWRCKIKF